MTTVSDPTAHPPVLDPPSGVWDALRDGMSQDAVKEKESSCLLLPLPPCERGDMCCGGGTASYRLHSSTSLSLPVWGRLTAQWQHLALCFAFVKI